MTSLAAVRRTISAFALAALAGTALAVPAAAQDEPLPVSVTGPDSVNLSLQPEIAANPVNRASHRSSSDSGRPARPYRTMTESSGRSTTASTRSPWTQAPWPGSPRWTSPASAAGRAAPSTAWSPPAAVPRSTCGQDYNDLGGIRLDVTDESAAGDFGTISVTAAGEGLAFTGHTVDVLVGGPELRMKQLTEPEGFEYGDTFQAPLSFRNQGGLGGKGVVLRVSGTRGLSFPSTFGNCWYDPRDADDLRGWSTALCVFDSEFAAGAAYGLSTPFPIGTAGLRALRLDVVLLQRGARRQGGGPAGRGRLPAGYRAGAGAGAAAGRRSVGLHAVRGDGLPDEEHLRPRPDR